MLRLTLGGPALAGFHTYQADDHVKIVFPDADGVRRDPVPNDDLMLDWPRPFPTTREYTVRWLVRRDAVSSLAPEVRGLELPPGRVFLFAAGEATDIKPLRSWVKGRMDALFTGYWKRGVAAYDE